MLATAIVDKSNLLLNMAPGLLQQVNFGEYYAHAKFPIATIVTHSQTLYSIPA